MIYSSFAVDFWYNTNMQVYHASHEVVEFPEIRKGRFAKDFSWGFYCTKLKSQAKRWANRGDGEPIVNVYEYTETLVALFSSFLSDAISDFKTGIYFENLSYLLASYRAGKLLDAA